MKRDRACSKGGTIESVRSRGVAQPGSAPALGQEPAESWPAFSCDPANSSENSNTSRQVIRHESPRGTAPHHQKCHAECHTSCGSGRHSCSGFSSHHPNMATGRSNVHILPASRLGGCATSNASRFSSGSPTTSARHRMADAWNAQCCSPAFSKVAARLQTGGGVCRQG